MLAESACDGGPENGDSDRIQADLYQAEGNDKRDRLRVAKQELHGSKRQNSDQIGGVSVHLRSNRVK